MSKRKKFEQSLLANKYSYSQYLYKLTELALSVFEWKNLPDTINERYLELTLFENGSAIYFQDEVTGDLALTLTPMGRLDVYGEPIKRRAYSMFNNYQIELDNSNSVIIWNNYLHTNDALNISEFAQKLYLIDRTMDVNIQGQRTPVIIQCDEKQRLTMENLFMQYEGNIPFIYAEKNLDLTQVKAIELNVPFVADKLYDLKSSVWNEALTYLGITNVNTLKKERLISDEVVRAQGGAMASRFSKLYSRKDACNKINKMFGTNIDVDFRDINVDLLEESEGNNGKLYNASEVNL